MTIFGITHGTLSEYGIITAFSYVLVVFSWFALAEYVFGRETGWILRAPVSLGDRVSAWKRSRPQGYQARECSSSLE